MNFDSPEEEVESFPALYIGPSSSNQNDIDYEAEEEKKKKKDTRKDKGYATLVGGESSQEEEIPETMETPVNSSSTKVKKLKAFKLSTKKKDKDKEKEKEKKSSEKKEKATEKEKEKKSSEKKEKATEKERKSSEKTIEKEKKAKEKEKAKHSHEKEKSSEKETKQGSSSSSSKTQSSSIDKQPSGLNAFLNAPAPIILLKKFKEKEKERKDKDKEVKKSDKVKLRLKLTSKLSLDESQNSDNNTNTPNQFDVQILTKKIQKYEALLEQTHAHLKASKKESKSKKIEEQLWEIQRNLTQLKRQLRSINVLSNTERKQKSPTPVANPVLQTRPFQPMKKILLVDKSTEKEKFSNDNESEKAIIEESKVLHKEVIKVEQESAVAAITTTIDEPDNNNKHSPINEPEPEIHLDERGEDREEEDEEEEEIMLDFTLKPSKTYEKFFEHKYVSKSVENFKNEINDENFVNKDKEDETPIPIEDIETKLTKYQTSSNLSKEKEFQHQDSIASIEHVQVEVDVHHSPEEYNSSKDHDTAEEVTEEIVEIISKQRTYALCKDDNERTISISEAEPLEPAPILLKDDTLDDTLESFNEDYDYSNIIKKLDFKSCYEDILDREDSEEAGEVEEDDEDEIFVQQKESHKRSGISTNTAELIGFDPFNMPEFETDEYLKIENKALREFNESLITQIENEEKEISSLMNQLLAMQNAGIDIDIPENQYDLDDYNTDELISLWQISKIENNSLNEHIATLRYMVAESKQEQFRLETRVNYLENKAEEEEFSDNNEDSAL